MTYTVMREPDVAEIARLYMDYYNGCEGGCWTLGKACRRIRQMVTIEDSLCLIQRGDEGNVTGFVIGYFKEYDDLTAYYLEEIVIFAAYQNKGLGRQFLAEIERRARARGAEHIELTSVNDEHHMRFYKGFGMYEGENLRIMGKHFRQ
ncbi:MAG: GNAT family N-acetyltransferase [Eubacteriales bacterium]|nr:GNAT family N-acetyltransferase [Eubacteriales bacterium]